MGVMVTPFVVSQIQSNRRTESYRGSPSVYPTSGFSRRFPLFVGFLVALASSHVDGTRCFVKPLPMSLLTCLRLYVWMRAWQGGSELEFRDTVDLERLTQ